MASFKKAILSLFIIFISTCGYSFATSTLSLADALQSNMVVQQNKPFKVWGKAVSGSKVTIRADWMQKAMEVYANDKGDFLGIIPVPEAKKGDFTKHSLSVNSGETKIILENLLIGDLWFCSGQSNMQFSVKEMIDAKDVLAGADQPHIRLLNVALNFSDTPIENFKGKWQECSTETVKDFSAVGYSFGKKLYDELNIPIGLVFSGIGASGVQAYIPREELERNAELNKTYLKPYLESPKSKEKIDGGFSFEKVVRPYLLYNAMIHPLVNLSIKGFCWYQGEANHLERQSYVTATQTMISSWRGQFSQGELPFFYVQIAPFFHDKEDPSLAFDAFFREAQEQVAGLNNTYMVTTMDVGEAKDLHPKNKKPIGLRLAANALNRTYNRLSVVYQGPSYSYADFGKYKATIHFKPETLGGGLNTNDGQAPKFFYMAGDDGVFHPATAVIEGDRIIVQNKKIKQPKAVRYAFFNYPVTNLQNKEGFPVVPLRTDNWKEK